jgi:SPP1 gp7 family putative phage head morphogenesis protein
MSLFDATMRHQILLERVKLWQLSQYMRTHADIKKTVRTVIGALSVMNMTDLSISAVRALQNKLRKAIQKLLNAYSAALQAFLKSLCDIDRLLSIAISQEFFDASLDEQKKKNGLLPLFSLLAVTNTDALFTFIRNEPMPANGLAIEESVDQFSAGVINSITQRIAAGYANSETPSQTLQAIVGTDKIYGRDGILNRTVRQARATINTTTQHVSTLTQAGVQSLWSTRYMWISIVDDRTTAICLSRDRNIYAYATGPQPPAHPNCRSRIVPFDEDEPIPVFSTIYEYWQAQTADIRNALGTVRSGQPYSGVSRPLTLAQLSANLPTLLE